MVDHPVYIYVADSQKDELVSAIVSVTSHKFLIASVKVNVFLGLPSPRRVTCVDFCTSLTLAGIDDVDVEVFGQKASVPSYVWMNQLPSTSTSFVDFGWCV